MDVKRCLSEKIRHAICGCGAAWENITDIRLRAGNCSSVTGLCGGEVRNIPLPSLITEEEELRTVLSRLCAGSVHVYEEGLLRGYFSPQILPGVRVGVAGRMLCRDGRAEILQRLTSLCIRMPHAVLTDGAEYSRLRTLVYGGDGDCTDGTEDMQRREKTVSTLFYAPPGEGKTTLLRGLIRVLCAVNGAQVPISAAVLDTSEELCGEGFSDCTVDRFCGYPRGLAMEIATRAFAPQVIICDEIGSESEADEILRAQACGIPLIATAHADTLSALLRRPCFARLYENGVFARYVRLFRRADGRYGFVCERVQ